MFSAELIIKPTDNRRSTRSKVDMPGRVTTEGSWRSVCRIADLSRHGARLSTFTALTRGTVVWLNIAGHPARKAEIVWADEFNAACQFYQPLDERAVIALVGRFGFKVEPDRPIEDMIMVA
ncbi:PilZ domain-containing protein [Sphingomonas sp. 28-63-12]|uniref:PilZ domain-containing protein n=1 Tax=Sphingomonas sp. 28-63-12 TaxID=1970434 RepID=UPI0035A91627